MKIEYKIANQSPRMRFNSGDPKSTCAKCNTLVDKPLHTKIEAEDDLGKQHYFTVYNYFTKDHFIFDTKSGFSIVYCSEYCMKKHNHRFTRKP